MIKTCLQAFGVELNRIWAQKTNFLGSVVKWVAPAQVGCATQVGSARSILHWLWRSSGSRPSSGQHPLKWVACPPNTVQNYENLSTAFKNSTSTSALRIFGK